MSRTHSRRPTLQQRPGGTLVGHLYSKATRLVALARTTKPGHRLIDVERELQETMATLAAAPAESNADIDAKLTILCGRLRQLLFPDQADEVITYLLAESIREDHRVLSHAAIPLETDDA